MHIANTPHRGIGRRAPQNSKIVQKEKKILSTQRSPKKIDGITWWCSVVKVKVGLQFPLLPVELLLLLLLRMLFVFWGVWEFIYWRRLASFLPRILNPVHSIPASSAAVGQHFSAGFIYLQRFRTDCQSNGLNKKLTATC